MPVSNGNYQVKNNTPSKKVFPHVEIFQNTLVDSKIKYLNHVNSYCLIYLLFTDFIEIHLMAPSLQHLFSIIKSG